MPISQFGILLLLLLTGMETDLKLVRKVGRAAISISLDRRRGAVRLRRRARPVPAGIAAAGSRQAPADRRCSSAPRLSISSIKIVAAIVREMNFTRRNLGQVIVASAIMEDTIGWIIIAITFGLAEAGTIDLASVAKSVLGTAVFLVASFTIGRRIVFYADPLGQRQFRERVPGHHHHPGDHGRDGADHAFHRRAHRARRLRGRRADRRIADPHQAHRRAAARPDHGVLHAGVLRHWPA